MIVLLRDGRDVACSLRRRTGDLEAGIERWVEDNAAAEPFFDHESVHVLTYEAPVAERRRALEGLTRFLEEPFEEQLLEHQNSSFRFYGRYQGAQRMAQQIEQRDAAPETVTGQDHRLYRSWRVRQAVFDGRGRWEAELSV